MDNPPPKLGSENLTYFGLKIHRPKTSTTDPKNSHPLQSFQYNVVTLVEFQLKPLELPSVKIGYTPYPFFGAATCCSCCILLYSRLLQVTGKRAKLTTVTFEFGLGKRKTKQTGSLIIFGPMIFDFYSLGPISLPGKAWG